MSAPIARVLKARGTLGKPKDRDAFVFAHCEAAGHRDDLPARGSWRCDTPTARSPPMPELTIRSSGSFEAGHRERSEDYITRLVLAAGQGIRGAQRKVSRRIIQLLGADPTR